MVKVSDGYQGEKSNLFENDQNKFHILRPKLSNVFCCRRHRLASLAKFLKKKMVCKHCSCVRMGRVFSYGYSVVFSPFRARLTDCVSRGILKLHVEMLSVNTVRLLLPTYLQFASSASTVCKEPTWQASCRICLT